MARRGIGKSFRFNCDFLHKKASLFVPLLQHWKVDKCLFIIQCMPAQSQRHCFKTLKKNKKNCKICEK